ncbi:SHD1 domain-containing protein [Adhaeretor mobilis]|uniref:SLA1 homology domain-containing protein n=1 Tax=Adhaeretor mobilis TaxID=1930276 RepID=A0A517MPK4_9BACT|nr:SHD1 domain-containing protein [Adhaeretor mobilis]QDS96811.1 hypothetical protein HG15A2_00690 [Adhaeretor mobilis]
MKNLMFLATACFLLPLLPQPCFGIEAGTAESYKARARAERAASLRKYEERENWEQSKKLSLTKIIPKSPRKYDDCLSIRELKERSLGYLECWHLEVTQVLSETELLISPIKGDAQSLWLKDYPTKGIVDGDKIRLIGLARVEGTESYESVTGSNVTVRVVKLLSEKEALKFEMEAKAATEAALFRTWTSKTGKTKLEAKFIDFEKGYVSLELKKDKKLVKVRSTKLSKEDVKWIREELKKRKLQEELAKKEKAAKK